MSYMEQPKTTWNYKIVCCLKKGSPRLFLGVLLLLLLFFKNYIKYIYTYIGVRILNQSLFVYNAYNERCMVYVVV